MNSIFKKLNIEKITTLRFLIFVVIVVGISSAANYIDISKIAIAVTLVLLTIVMLFAWSFAIDVVMKSLLVVGAGLSLIIFLAKAYCEVPNTSPSSKDALAVLISSSLLYIAVKFFYRLYKEMDARYKAMKEKNKGKGSWIFLISFTFFVGFLVFAIGQVVIPIIQNLCIKIW